MLDIKLKLKPGHTSERNWMKPSPLKTLFWNITYNCNFHCPVCFTDAGETQPGELTTAQAFRAVQKIHEAGVHDVIISGGEPFIRGDMVDILEEMARFGISARIASNGSLLTDEILSRLKRTTLTKSFQISLDTVDPDSYERFHNASPGTFIRVMDTLGLIQEYGFHTTVSVRVMPETLPGIPRLLDLAVSKDWSTVTLHIPVLTRRVKNVFPVGADVISLLNPVFEQFCSLPQKWLVETYIPWAEYHPLIKTLASRVRVIYRGCRAGRDRLTINPTGMLSPCVCLDVPEAYVGNVKQDSLQDVFTHSEFCDLMRHPPDYGICEDCPNAATCGGGCRVMAHAFSGRLDGPDLSCPVRQRIGH